MSEVLSLDEARARRRASAPASLGPYETAYDTRRGYDQPAARPRPRLRRADEDEVFLFLARDDEDERR
jgi:hypothetical protein